MHIVAWGYLNYIMNGHSTVCLAAYVDPHQRNIKLRITGPLWGEFTGDQLRGKYFRLMTSSWNIIQNASGCIIEIYSSNTQSLMSAVIRLNYRVPA